MKNHTGIEERCNNRHDGRRVGVRWLINKFGPLGRNRGIGEIRMRRIDHLLGPSSSGGDLREEGWGEEASGCLTTPNRPPARTQAFSR